MNLTTHFTLEEAVFSAEAVRKGIDNKPNSEQVAAIQQAAIGMEQVRGLLGGNPVHINSWLRVPELNAAIGGAKNSAHMQGYAVDFTCAIYGPPIEVVKRLQAGGLVFDQLIYEGTWVHVSFAPELRGQVLTAHFGGPHGAVYTEGV